MTTTNLRQSAATNNHTGMQCPVTERDPVNETVNETVNALSPRARQLLNLMRANPALTYQQAASALDVSYTTAWRTFQTLRKAGIIERIGSDKRGTWHILEAPRP